MSESSTVVRLEQWPGGLFFLVTMAEARKIHIGDHVEIEIDRQNKVASARVNGEPIRLPKEQSADPCEPADNREAVQAIPNK